MIQETHGFLQSSWQQMVSPSDVDLVYRRIPRLFLFMIFMFHRKHLGRSILKHIWKFAAAFIKKKTTSAELGCPCSLKGKFNSSLRQRLSRVQSTGYNGGVNRQRDRIESDVSSQYRARGLKMINGCNHIRCVLIYGKDWRFFFFPSLKPAARQTIYR